MCEMKAPIGLKPSHITLLATLAQVRECKYVQFRFEHNPWRRESYFDGQMKWLANKGFLVFTISRTIQITECGMRFVHLYLPFLLAGTRPACERRTSMVRITKKQKQQLIDDFEELVACSNDLWKLRITLDFAIDNVKATLREMELLEECEA